MHQFGTAFGLYATDNDDGFPNAPSPWAKYLYQTGQADSEDPKAFERPDLRIPLASYKVTADIWHCPEDEIASDARKSWPSPSYFESTGGSYRYDQDAAYSGLTYTSIEKPSGWCQMFEVESFHGGSREDHVAGRRGNVLFFDFHIKSVSDSQINYLLRPQSSGSDLLQ